MPGAGLHIHLTEFLEPEVFKWVVLSYIIGEGILRGYLCIQVWCLDFWFGYRGRIGRLTFTATVR